MKPKEEISSATRFPKAKRLLTTNEAGEYLNIAPGTLQNWRSERRGPPFVTLSARMVRYKLSDLEEWIQKNSTNFAATGD